MFEEGHFDPGQKSCQPFEETVTSTFHGLFDDFGCKVKAAAAAAAASRKKGEVKSIIIEKMRRECLLSRELALARDLPFSSWS